MRSISMAWSFAALTALGCTPFLGPIPDANGDLAPTSTVNDRQNDARDQTDNAALDGDVSASADAAVSAGAVPDAGPPDASPLDSAIGSRSDAALSDRASDGLIDASGAPADSSGPDGLSSGPPHTHLALWLAADKGVALTEGLLSRWADQSGQALDAVQDDAKFRPTILPAALNGLPVVHFSNLQSLILPPGFSDLTNGLVILVVARPLKPTQLETKPINLFQFLNADSQAVAGSGVKFQVGAIAEATGMISVPALNFYVGGDGFGVVDVSFDDWQLFEVDQWGGMPGQSTVCRTLVNGIELDVEQCPVPSVTYRDANSVASILLSADVAELLVYDASSDDITVSAEQYLLKKWALK